MFKWILYKRCLWFMVFFSLVSSNSFANLQLFTAGANKTNNAGSFINGMAEMKTNSRSIMSSTRDSFRDQLIIALNNAQRIIPTIPLAEREKYLDATQRLMSEVSEKWSRKGYSSEEVLAILRPYRNWHTEEVDALKAQLASARGWAGVREKEARLAERRMEIDIPALEAERDVALQRADDAERRAEEAEAARRLAEARPPRVIEREVEKIVEVVSPAMQADLDRLRLVEQTKADETKRAVDAERKAAEGLEEARERLAEAREAHKKVLEAANEKAAAAEREIEKARLAKLEAERKTAAAVVAAEDKFKAQLAQDKENAARGLAEKEAAWKEERGRLEEAHRLALGAETEKAVAAEEARKAEVAKAEAAEELRLQLEQKDRELAEKLEEEKNAAEAARKRLEEEKERSKAAALLAAQTAREEAVAAAELKTAADVKTAEDKFTAQLAQEKESAAAALEEERKELVNLRAQLLTLTAEKEERDAEDQEALTRSQIIRMRSLKLVTAAEARLDTTKKELEESRDKAPQGFKEDDFSILGLKIRSEILDKDVGEIGYDISALVATRSLLNAMANVQQGFFGVNVAKIARIIESLQIPTTSPEDATKLEEEIDVLEGENEGILQQKNQITDQMMGLDRQIYKIRVKEESDKKDLEKANQELMGRSSIFISGAEDRDRKIAELEKQLQELQKSKEESVEAAKNAQAALEEEKERSRAALLAAQTARGEAVAAAESKTATDVKAAEDKFNTQLAQEKESAAAALEEEKERSRAALLDAEKTKKEAEAATEAKGAAARELAEAKEAHRLALAEAQEGFRRELIDRSVADEKKQNEIIASFGKDIDKLNEEGRKALETLRLLREENEKLSRLLGEYISPEDLAMRMAATEKGLLTAEEARIKAEERARQLEQENLVRFKRGLRVAAALRNSISDDQGIREKGVEELLVTVLGGTAPTVREHAVISNIRVLSPKAISDENIIEFLKRVIDAGVLPSAEIPKDMDPQTAAGKQQLATTQLSKDFVNVFLTKLITRINENKGRCETSAEELIGKTGTTRIRIKGELGGSKINLRSSAALLFEFLNLLRTGNVYIGAYKGKKEELKSEDLKGTVKLISLVNLKTSSDLTSLLSELKDKYAIEAGAQKPAAKKPAGAGPPK